MRQELADRRRHVDRLRDEFDPHRPEATGVGSDIASSWRRCAPRLAVGQLAPRDPADPGERWLDSPLRSAAADVIAEFARLAVSENYIAALLDAEGEIVWSASGRSMARFAERAHFVPGTGWREDQAGTNAPGLVLCTGRPEAVFAREHWCMAVQDWVCYAAPVRSPSGLLVGVLDLSATWRQASPLALAAVGAMARVAEQEIAQSGSWERADLCLDVLGTPRARLHGEPVHLPLRQLEILTVLAVDGEISLESLYDKLYGEVGVSVATLKAEISHLRHLLGGCLGSRPYRLTLSVRADVVEILRAIRQGDLEGAIRRYRGQLLPASESPYVIQLRHHVDVALRTTLLGQGTPAQLLAYADVNPFDLEVLEWARSRTGSGDPLLAEIVARGEADSG